MCCHIKENPRVDGGLRRGKFSLQLPASNYVLLICSYGYSTSCFTLCQYARIIVNIQRYHRVNFHDVGRVTPSIAVYLAHVHALARYRGWYLFIRCGPYHSFNSPRTDHTAWGWRTPADVSCVLRLIHYPSADGQAMRTSRPRRPLRQAIVLSTP